MLHKIKLDHILFLDIETVPQYASFDDLDITTQQLYAHKTQYQRKDDITAQQFYDRAGIWAEFGKIVCISVGYFVDQTIRQFRVRSYTGDESELLQQFGQLLDQYFNTQDHLLCAHNGKEFDFPYIARRMIINGITLPDKLNLFGKKPWEVPHLDTLELWKFGDYKHFTSLKLMTHILGIPSPKDDIDGSQVRDVYYQDQDVARIATYCEKDVVAVAQILLKLRLEPLLTEQQIVTQ